jgi:transposase
MYSYYELYRNSKDPVQYRAEIVREAQKHGIKRTARKFKTTPKTVRKWIRRFEEEKKPGLHDRSRRPKRSPNQMSRYWYFKVQDVCKEAQRKNKRITAVRIQRKYTVPYSTNTILKVMRETGFLPQKRRKYQRKRDLREIKRQMKVFEKIQVDIKYLDDIPEFYGTYRVFHLPRYQITARCVRTGALFFSYAMEKSSTNTTMFILLLAEHLRRHGVYIADIVFQTDNGTEFTTPWNSLETSAFTNAIERVINAKHILIPPGAKTWQSDVETSHRLIEDEFYACEEFFSRVNFMKQAATYQRYFNSERYNSYKEGTPLQLLTSLAPEINQDVLFFKPVVIDKFYRRFKHVFKSLAA